MWAVGNEDLVKDLVRTYYRQSVSEVLSHFRERIGHTGSDINFGSSCNKRILRLETGKLGVNWWIEMHRTDFEDRNR